MKCFAAAVLASLGSATDVSPIGKVVQLISDLEAKVIREGETSQKTYAEFSEWCEDRARDLSHEIKTGSADVDSLKASIAASTASIQGSNAKIDDLAGDIATDEADLEAAQHIRASEAASFKAEESELVDTISMLTRATGILEREMAKGSASMVQLKDAQSVASALTALVQASFMDSADAKRLTALVQTSDQDADSDPGAPAGALYESHSGDVVETLRGVLEKAEASLDQARKQETANVHQFEMLQQSLSDELKFGNSDMAEAKSVMAQASEAKATSEGGLEVASKELAADSDAKSELHQNCMTKAEDFESEVKSRAEELKALAEAKKVIVEATGGATGIVYSGASFLQAASQSRLATTADLKGLEVVHMVRDLARREKSAALAQLAMRLASVRRSGSADPFVKIKGLISEMIDRLESEAAADATKKAHCDKELKETNEKKDDKTAEIEKLTVRIDRDAAKSKVLKGEVSELQKQLSSLAASQAEMDKMRASEHEAFQQNQADMEQGLQGVKTALKVLNEYYASEDKAHTAAQGAGAGIIGLLEVVESDFSKNLAEIQSAEETAAADYEKETKENDVERTTKSKSVEYKTKAFTYADGEVNTISADRSNVQAELDSILEYLTSIEGQCTEVAETYADRTAHRAAEIAGLKSALETLETETSLVQTRQRRFRGISRHMA